MIELLPEPSTRPTEEWDDSWMAVLADDSQRDRQTHPKTASGSLLLRYLSAFDERPWRRVVCAGNGISMEPHALAHLGYDVTAVDVSPAACEAMEALKCTDRVLARYLPEFEEVEHNHYRFDLDQSLARLPDKKKEGGAVHVVCADLLQFDPAEAFDIVYWPRSFMCLAQSHRSELPARVFSWTAPGGMCLLSTVNIARFEPGPERRKQVERSFAAVGFMLRRAHAGEWLEQCPTSFEGRWERYRELAAEDDNDAVVGLDAELVFERAVFHFPITPITAETLFSRLGGGFPPELVPHPEHLLPEPEKAARERYRGFGAGLFERLYEAMPGLDGALHFYRHTKQQTDVWCYADIDGKLIGIQLDPDIEVICVWDTDSAIEIGDWKADPVGAAITNAQERLGG